MNQKATIYYDGINFNSASELETYVKLEAAINGIHRTQSEINLIVQTAIEESLEDEIDTDDEFVSLEQMKEVEFDEDNYFDSYDLEHESELDFN